MKTTPNLKKSCLAIALIFGPGCAALTIDVDVYKGPMTNHQEVQVRQVSGMTQGAIPLLEKLKYQLLEKCKQLEPEKVFDAASKLNKTVAQLRQAKDDYNKDKGKQSALEAKLFAAEKNVEEYQALLETTDNELRNARQETAWFDAAVEESKAQHNKATSDKIAAAKNITQIKDNNSREYKEAEEKLGLATLEEKIAKTSFEKARENLDQARKKAQIPSLELRQKQVGDLLKKVTAEKNTVSEEYKTNTATAKENLEKQIHLQTQYDTETKEYFKNTTVKDISKKLDEGAFIGASTLCSNIKILDDIISEYNDSTDNKPSLKTLIDNYENEGNKDTTKKSKLLNALIPFSEKIRYVANYANLLLDEKKDTSGDEKDTSLESYIRLLQAVGNSIFYQIDEIKQYEKYTKDITDKGKAEQWALNEKMSGYAPAPTNRTPSEPKLNAIQVMDQLIATLKYEYVNAVKGNGENNDKSKNLAAAIKSAYEHRADMVQIRPALAYLRTSFPSTDLQGDANLDSKNILQEGMFSNLPIFGDMIKSLRPEEKKEREKARLNRDIDKQFWQNINRIRLGGGGNTNYVVIKDDVGNWVVKNYSADPKVIVESAKNLALFGMGSKMGANLLGKATAGGPGAGGPAGQAQPVKEAKPDQTPMERQYDAFKATYDTQTEKDLENLKNDLSTLKSRIQQKLKDNDITGCDSALDTAENPYLKNAIAKTDAPKSESPGNSVRGNLIIDSLKNVIYFKSTADAEVYKAILGPAKKSLEAVKNKNSADISDAKKNLEAVKNKNSADILDAEKKLEAVKNKNDADILDAEKNLENAKKQYQSARTLMHGEIKADLDKYLNKRMQVVGQFAGAVEITNKILNPPEEKPVVKQ